MKEINIQNLIVMEAAKIGCILFRNHVGGFYTKDGRFQKTGLCVGSSDLIGIYKGRFVAVEVKAERGRTSPEQEKFLGMVLKNGGIAGVARSTEEFLKIISDQA